jgi:hypothetical protein
VSFLSVLKVDSYDSRTIDHSFLVENYSDYNLEDIETLIFLKEFPQEGDEASSVMSERVKF